MNPLVLTALIEGGSKLLGGLLSSAGKGKAAKQLKAGTKPTRPFYETYSTLPVWQELFQKSLLGALRDRFGDETLSSWGIDPNVLLSKFRAPRLWGSSPYERILSKYTAFNGR